MRGRIGAGISRASASQWIACRRGDRVAEGVFITMMRGVAAGMSTLSRRCGTADHLNRFAALSTSR